MDSNNDKGNTGSRINDILRDLKPRGMDIPPPRPPLVDPLPDFKPGGIDAILASLQPKKPSHDISEPAQQATSAANDALLEPPSVSTSARDVDTMSTTTHARRHLANLNLASTAADVNNTTPKAKPKLSMANLRIMGQARQEEKSLMKEIEKMKQKIADAEAKNKTE